MTVTEPIHQEIAASISRVELSGRPEKATLPVDVVDLAIRIMETTPEIRAAIRYRVLPAGRKAKTIEIYHKDNLPRETARVVPAVAKAVTKVRKGTQRRKSAKQGSMCQFCNASVDQLATPALFRCSGGALPPGVTVVLCQRHAMQEAVVPTVRILKV
jgi:hypothetical protein